MLKLAPLGRKSKTLNDLILVSMPRRHSMSWAHNSLDEFPTETPPRRLPPSQAAPFGHCPTYTKIIKSRLSSRSVENLWINKIFDFSRIFFGLTLNHVILQNTNMVSQPTYLTIQFWVIQIWLRGGFMFRAMLSVTVQSTVEGHDSWLMDRTRWSNWTKDLNLTVWGMGSPKILKISQGRKFFKIF